MSFATFFFLIFIITLRQHIFLNQTDEDYYFDNVSFHIIFNIYMMNKMSIFIFIFIYFAFFSPFHVFIVLFILVI
jgi:hypothetical protein